MDYYLKYCNLFWVTFFVKHPVLRNSLLNWFRENHMKVNADKFHLFVSSDESCTVKIEDFSIKNSTEEKLLGVKFDSNLSFEYHVTSLCKKAS